MSDVEDGLNIFQEPPDYYKPDKPYTLQAYTLNSGKVINLRLVGDSPLWVSCDLVRKGVK